MPYSCTFAFLSILKDEVCVTKNFSVLATVSVFALLPSLAFALPVGGQVTAGQASISSTANQTTVNQTTSRTVIDWQGFNVGSGQDVQFNQPSSSAVALNRVNSGSASVIDGMVSGNGNVWVINPDGVVFGKTAQVNVGGLLATTSNIRNNDFMAGNYHFTPGGNAGASVSNAGSITVAQGGLAALVAPSVANSGTITATLGKVQLGAGDTYTLDLYGDGLINFQASPALTSQLVANSGTIAANGGSVTLTTGAAAHEVSSLINLDGLVQADTVDGKTGTVTVKTDGTTNFSGQINARGGATGGNGGNVEVSGDTLNFTGFVDTRAPKGNAGNLLLDPTDLYILADGAPPEANASSIPAGLLEAELDASNVTLQTLSTGTQSGNITLLTPLNWSVANTLKLSATKDIDINAPLTTAGGSLNFTYSGKLRFGAGGYVTYLNPSGSLTINGTPYVLATNFTSLLSEVSNNPTGYYALANNLNASGTTYASSPGGVFSGTLEGLGNTISNLTVASTAPGTGKSPANVGLFNTLTGTVASLGLVDTTLSSASNSVANLGTVAGINTGTIFNSYASGGSATCANLYGCGAGGLVGANGGTISQSWANITVIGQATALGGLVGSNSGTISQSYASGAVGEPDNIGYSGGLVGFDYAGNITQSYATGSVTSGTSMGRAGICGGLIGSIESTIATVSQSYSTGGVTGASGYIGGFAGSNLGTVSGSYWNTVTSGLSHAVATGPSAGSSAGITGLTTANLEGGLPAGFDPTVWQHTTKVNSGAPSFIWQTPYAGLTGSPGTQWYEANQFSPLKANWHTYNTGWETDAMCTANGSCTQAVLENALLRFAVPGQDYTIQVLNHTLYHVFAGSVWVGDVITNVYNGGLGIVNTTQQNHDLYDGKIVRIAYESNGKWYVVTNGFGNNNNQYWADFNQDMGPEIFRDIDENMSKYIAGDMPPS
jgi:filamentous hemagglutinin family protein